MKQWTALHLLLPQEFQEMISNFLMEQGATGLEETGENQGVVLKAYFPKDGKENRRAYALHRYLKSLKRIFPGNFYCQVKTSLLHEQDWGENWKKFFKPVSIGSRFVVFPPWGKVRLKKKQIPIDITPKMAFGTGTHATTQLCMRALERMLRGKGLSVLDVRTGSGILAIASAKLGAQEVWGVDIDEIALEGARENIEKNGVTGIVRIRKGSAGRIQKRFDIVVANIDFKGLKRLRCSLLRRLKDRGFLILSGILIEQEDGISSRFLETKVLRLMRADRQEEWACLTFKKREGFKV
jgi:ribosomal protein L11 methyltransferase